MNTEPPPITPPAAPEASSAALVSRVDAHDCGAAAESLAPSVRWVWLFRNLLAAFFWTVAALAGDIAAAERHGLPPGLLASAVGVLALALALVHPFLRYERYRFRLAATDLSVCDGVWWRSRVCVPRPRIQHVDIESGPVSRSLGLCTLSVYTAGAMSAAASISGLSPERAARLRVELLAEGGP